VRVFSALSDAKQWIAPHINYLCCSLYQYKGNNTDEQSCVRKQPSRSAKSVIDGYIYVNLVIAVVFPIDVSIHAL